MLGFDVGARRIGVAVGSAFGSGARALAVVDVHGHGPDWTCIDRLRKEWRPDGLIVGDPMTLEGGDQPDPPACACASPASCASAIELPVVLVDERSSSIEAAQRFAADRAEGRKRRRDADALDAVAAAVIIERWLAAPGRCHRKFPCTLPTSPTLHDRIRRPDDRRTPAPPADPGRPAPRRNWSRCSIVRRPFADGGDDAHAHWRHRRVHAVLRAVHAHPHELPAGRAAAGRGRAELRRLHVVDPQGRDRAATR